MAINKYLGPTGLTELINLIQADFQKKQDWFQFPEMPDATLYHGKVIQYTGITNNTYTKGAFYYSNGLEWKNISSNSAIEFYETLPSWDDAKANTIYYVTSEHTLYVKSTEPGEWDNISGGISKAFELVAELPSWDAADSMLIYMIPAEDDSTVTVYVKNEDVPGEFYQLGHATQVTVSIQKYPDSEHYDPSAVYPDTPEVVNVNELEVAAFKDEEILQLYNEV